MNFFRKNKPHVHDFKNNGIDLYSEVYRQIIIDHKMRAVIHQKCNSCEEKRFVTSSLVFNSPTEIFCTCGRDSINTSCKIHGEIT